MTTATETTPAERATSIRAARGPGDSVGYTVFRICNGIALTLVCVATIYPFWNVVARSLSSSEYINAGKVNLIPRGFTLETYRRVIANEIFWIDYRNTITYTLVATVISMVLTTCYAYVLSKQRLKGQRLLIGIAVFTMFFNGGLIPNYVLISTLGLRDTIWALVLPNAISVFNLLVMKSFFEGIPAELEEAAQTDGLNTYGILLRIVLPLSKAVLATMVLFYAVANWNSWFSAFLYMDSAEHMPVTVYLRNLIAGATSGTGEASADAISIAANVQAVTMVLTTLPILCVYPFLQKHFVSGVMIGAVKG